MLESLIYPVLLIVLWQGFSLLVGGAWGGLDVAHQAMLLLGALFALLALQTVLRIVDDTTTNILRAESAQQVNGRIISKMSEVPYHLFEDNDFQARYGLLISQASYRPGMLVEAFVGTLSALAASLGIAVTLLALAPLLDVFLLVLIPLMLAETRYHARVVELQTHSASGLFRMMYLAQK
ncbi:MAG: hypothetical protein LC797_22205, partial [Chloroflexi bacterium]|nr:hypothetical protein [Chloroflexota bacterium]